MVTFQVIKGEMIEPTKKRIRLEALSTFPVDNLPVTLWKTIPNPLVSCIYSVLYHRGAEKNIN